MAQFAMLGPLLTSWTIRLALACYALYIAFALTPIARAKPRLAGAIWTTGCGFFLLHVACAFHFYHHWSHRAAWQQTAAETAQLLGVAFGDGIYFSYTFLALWVLDVLWFWTAGSPRLRSAPSATDVPSGQTTSAMTPTWRLAVHAFLLFIALNGAIVFEAGPTRWVGVPVVVALLCLAVWWAVSARHPAKDLPGREIVHEAQANAECVARTAECSDG